MQILIYANRPQRLKSSHEQTSRYMRW